MALGWARTKRQCSPSTELFVQPVTEYSAKALLCLRQIRPNYKHCRTLLWGSAWVMSTWHPYSIYIKVHSIQKSHEYEHLTERSLTDQPNITLYTLKPNRNKNVIPFLYFYKKLEGPCTRDVQKDSALSYFIGNSEGRSSNQSCHVTSSVWHLRSEGRWLCSKVRKKKHQTHNDTNDTIIINTINKTSTQHSTIKSSNHPAQQTSQNNPHWLTRHLSHTQNLHQSYPTVNPITPPAPANFLQPSLKQSSTYSTIFQIFILSTSNSPSTQQHYKRTQPI